MTTTAATDADEPGNPPTTTTAATAGTAGTAGARPRSAEALDAPGPDDPHPRLRRLPDAARAAAVTPHTVLPTAPGEFVGRAGATAVDVRERTA